MQLAACRVTERMKPGAIAGQRVALGALVLKLGVRLPKRSKSGVRDQAFGIRGSVLVRQTC